MSHILIIDHDMGTIELEREYLEMNSYTVSVEVSGYEGMNHAMRTEIDLVLTAVDLPEVDGFEICKHIRKKRDIPVLFVSERGREIDIVRGLGVGADDYIRKPFSPNELVARVKANLACYERLTNKENGEHSFISYPGFRLDKESRRVFVEGKERFFTNKEFDLLCFLAAHPNRVYSKEELFNAVWGMDSFGEIATVTVHIKKIRKKLGQGGSEPGFIETVWGAGYRFRVLREE